MGIVRVVQGDLITPHADTTVANAQAPAHCWHKQRNLHGLVACYFITMSLLIKLLFLKVL